MLWWQTVGTVLLNFIFSVLGFLAALGFTACGGGSVSISQFDSTRGKIPASRLLDELETSLETPGRTVDLLSQLTAVPYERLDWDGFWTELARRPFRQKLVQNYEAPLLRLHERDCETYPSFVQFLTSVDRGLSYVLSAERHCEKKLPIQLVLQITDLAAQRAQGPARDERLAQALIFLRSEVRADGYSAAWASALAERRSAIEGWGEELLGAARLEPYLSFTRELHHHNGLELSEGKFLSGVVHDSMVRERWFERFGFGEGVTELWNLARSPEITRGGFSEGALESFSDFLRSRFFDLPLDDSFAIRFAQTSSLLRLLWTGKSLARQLASLDRGLEMAERALEGVSPERLLTWLERAAEKLSGTDARLDFTWLALRRLDAANRSRFASSENLRRDAGAMAGPLGEVLSLLFETGEETEPARAKARVFDLCRRMEFYGIARERITPARLQTMLESSDAARPAGCFELETSDPEPVLLRSSAALAANFASVISTVENPLNLYAPRVRLGIVLAETRRRPPDQKRTLTPPSANAQVLPLLLGVTIPKRTLRFVPGTYFFVVHTAVRPAVSGAPLPPILPGYDGPSLELKTEFAPSPFPFFSVGGPGQRAALPNDGGRGDTSQVNFEALRDWLDAVASTDRLKVPKPVLPLLSELNFDHLEDLLQNAARNAAGGLQVFVIPEYVMQLSKKEQSKFYEVCEAALKKTLEKKNIEACLAEHLGPPAIAHLEEVLAQSKLDARISRSDLVSELNPLEVFRVDAGDPGPSVEDGPAGAPGRLEVP